MAVVCRLQCALSRLSFSKTAQNVFPTIKSNIFSDFTPKSTILPRLYSSYGQSPYMETLTDLPEFDVSKNPAEWKYVEKLLRKETVPQLLEKPEYPSGYKPPNPKAANGPYFIARTRNHMLPVYLHTTHRGQRKMSLVKKIDGDIWLMNEDLKTYLRSINNRIIATRVHEICGHIEVKGDFVIDIQEWALAKGF